jgi:methionyl aminopeptidase
MMTTTTTLEKNHDCNKQTTKVIRHGNWDFDYSTKCNIYSSDIESYDNNKFVHYNNTSEHVDIVKNYNNKNQNSNQLTKEDLDDFRKAALIHKIARKKALSMLCTNAKLSDLVDAVETIILKMCKQDPETYYLKGSNQNNEGGIAFPVGVNINNVAAHDSKTKNINGKGLDDDRVFNKGDVVKIDIGVHINGRIIDSAFTHIVTDQPGVHDEKNIYNAVLEASRESVLTSIKMAGPDQRLDEMSETISEIINAFEVEIGDDALPVKPVEGIGGHNIKKYQIHGGKLILTTPDYDVQGDFRMEEDEIYAIETYASTGNGILTQNTDLDRCTHFMEANHDDINNDLEGNKGITKKDKKAFRQTEFYNWMQTRRGLPFSASWIDTKKVPRLEKAFKLGIPSGQLIAYPPLFDAENSVVAQFEHTIHVNDGSVEIFSLGDDY